MFLGGDVDILANILLLFLALVAIFGYLHFALKSNDPLEKANREFRNIERVK